jgi:hypothetical protein
VRAATDETIVVANGFSCKTQLEQSGVGRRALHVAQVMKLAREHRPQGYTPGKPEDGYSGAKPPAPRDLERKRTAALAGIGALAAGALAVTVRWLR